MDVAVVIGTAEHGHSQQPSRRQCCGRNGGSADMWPLCLTHIGNQATSSSRTWPRPLTTEKTLKAGRRADFMPFTPPSPLFASSMAAPSSKAVAFAHTPEPIADAIFALTEAYNADPSTPAPLPAPQLTPHRPQQDKPRPRSIQKTTQASHGSCLLSAVLRKSWPKTPQDTSISTASDMARSAACPPR